MSSRPASVWRSRSRARTEPPIDGYAAIAGALAAGTSAGGPTVRARAGRVSPPPAPRASGEQKAVSKEEVARALPGSGPEATRASGPHPSAQVKLSTEEMAKLLPRQTRPRWEDYLAPQTSEPLQPVPSIRGVLNLETGLEEAPTLVGEAGAATLEAVPLVARAGPFEIPELTTTTTERPPPAMGGLKLAIIGVFAAAWLGLALTPTARPATTPVVSSLTDVSLDGYARYQPVAVDSQVVEWMGRVGPSLLVQVGPRWEKLPAEERLLALRRWLVQTERPKEILVVGKNSELLAEVYEDRYHFYR